MRVGCRVCCHVKLTGQRAIVEKAKSFISAGVVHVQVEVSKAVGLQIIGKGGERIRELRQNCHASVDVVLDREPCIVQIAGTLESVATVQDTIRAEVASSQAQGNLQQSQFENCRDVDMASKPSAMTGVCQARNHAQEERRLDNLQNGRDVDVPCKASSIVPPEQGIRTQTTTVKVLLDGMDILAFQSGLPVNAPSDSQRPPAWEQLQAAADFYLKRGFLSSPSWNLFPSGGLVTWIRWISPN